MVLFAPYFDREAVDFDRMRRQTLIAGDVALAIGRQAPAATAGQLAAYRAARARGAKTCEEFAPDDLRRAFTPRDQAPGPGARPLRVRGEVARTLRARALRGHRPACEGRDHRPGPVRGPGHGAPAINGTP